MPKEISSGIIFRQDHFYDFLDLMPEHKHKYASTQNDHDTLASADHRRWAEIEAKER